MKQEFGGMIPMAESYINWATYSETRGALGEAFVRILGYFRDDGIKSVAHIEEAMRNRDSAALVIPAHTLKGESWQFGADALGALAEEIELRARHYVELRQDPDDLIETVVKLRPMFERTMAALEGEISPLIERRAPMGARRFGTLGQ